MGGSGTGRVQQSALDKPKVQVQIIIPANTGLSEGGGGFSVDIYYPCLKIAPMNITELSAPQLRKAAKIKEQISELETTLSKLLGSSSATTAAPIKRRRRKMSAVARKKIAAAAKARWAKTKAAGKKSL